MGLRRKSREIAVQTLYALDYIETQSYLKELELIEKYPTVLTEILQENELDKEHKNNEKITEYADHLVKNTLLNLSELDTKITKHSEKWDLSRIALIDLSILRIANYEMCIMKTPPAVIINEAVEIAKRFSNDSACKFIHAVLDAIAKEEGYHA